MGPKQALSRGVKMTFFLEKTNTEQDSLLCSDYFYKVLQQILGGRKQITLPGNKQKVV